MKQNDFRIGNLMLCSYTADNGQEMVNVCEIIAIGIDDKQFGTNFLFKCIQGSEVDEYEIVCPVKISIHWLERMGFKQTSKYRFNNNDIFIDYYFDREKYYITGLGVSPFEVEYVHEIQNWFYLLKNKTELSVKSV